jgi:hypothetical protein
MTARECVLCCFKDARYAKLGILKFRTLVISVRDKKLLELTPMNSCRSLILIFFVVIVAAQVFQKVV